MEDNNIIRNEIITLFKSLSQMISNDDGIKVSVFIKKKRNYFHLNDKNNEQKVAYELEKMETEGLIVFNNNFIKFTQKGKKEFFG